MARMLRLEERGYEATLLLVAEWKSRKAKVHHVRTDLTPPTLGAEHFMRTLIEAVLGRAPVAYDKRARELYAEAATASP